MTQPMTHQTRDAAYQLALPTQQNRMERAYECLREHPGGMTAGEVAEATRMKLNCARSALTELLNVRRVTTMNKRVCTAPTTSKRVKVAVWTLPMEGA